MVDGRVEKVMVTFSGEVKNAKVRTPTSCVKQEKSWCSVPCFRVIGNCMEVVSA